MSDPLHPLSLPLLTLPVYAAAIGLSLDTVRAQVERGLIPSVKVGKRRLVNVEALRVLSAAKAQERLL
jgi:excisionase family DNA binding protein